MKKISTIIGLSTVLILSGCIASQRQVEKNTQVAKGGLPIAKGVVKPINSAFHQHWINAYEEQGGNATLNIFRPAGSQDFSRGVSVWNLILNLMAPAPIKMPTQATCGAVFTQKSVKKSICIITKVQY